MASRHVFFSSGVWALEESSRMIYDHHTTGENDRHSSECQLFPREAFVSFILLFCISWILKSAQKVQGQALRRWLCPGHDIKRLKLASTASRSLRSRNDGRGSAVSAVVSSVLSSREVRVGSRDWLPPRAPRDGRRLLSATRHPKGEWLGRRGSIARGMFAARDPRATDTELEKCDVVHNVAHCSKTRLADAPPALKRRDAGWWTRNIRQRSNLGHAQLHRQRLEKSPT